jgi:hypothetical protein
MMPEMQVSLREAAEREADELRATIDSLQATIERVRGLCEEHDHLWVCREIRKAIGEQGDG